MIVIDCPYLRGVQPSQCFRRWSLRPRPVLKPWHKKRFSTEIFFLMQKEIIVFFSMLKPISFLMRMFWLCHPVVCLWMEQRMLSIPAGVSFWCMSQPDVWAHPIIHRRFASNHAVWVSQIGPFLLVWHFVRSLPPFRHFVLCWRARIAFFSSKGQRKLNDCISKVESYPPQLSGIEMRSRHVATNVQGS